MEQCRTVSKSGYRRRSFTSVRKMMLRIPSSQGWKHVAQIVGMNYHSHQHRDEVWTVIAGEGKTIVDGMEQNVKAGDVITMSAGCRHTVIAETELKLIEVQLGKEIDVNDKQKFELEY